ncbi:MAG: outer membrane beta-barrel protein, partial [Planctomycetota bacterium]
GGRLEWWKNDGASYQALTMGLNYRPHANFVIRPEVRYDWVASDGAAEAVSFTDADEYNNWSFGMDAIFTF